MKMINEIRDDLDYNPETGVFTWKRHRGQRYVAGRVAGGTDKDGYTLIGWRRKNYRGGRLAWWFVHGVWPEYEIDHINRVRNDDRIANLRPVTHFDNQFNRGKLKRRRVGLPGAHFKGDANRKRPWVAVISINGKSRTIGHFATMEEAAAAYEAARCDHLKTIAETSNATVSP